MDFRKDRVWGGDFFQVPLAGVYRPLYSGFEAGAEVIASTGLHGLVVCDALHQICHEAADGLAYSHWAYAWDIIQGHDASGHQGVLYCPGWLPVGQPSSPFG